ncbi:RecQ family ATP-dependent DNA helicase [Brevibacillus ginsengisoli]|uniref:RecQ family ATP-dependent DNA helicase n=1 Tax=Brevibacillus ginsengisoli TaxID=363854 RepID=UPI003CFAFBA4
MSKQSMNLEEKLRQYTGFESFRTGQREIVDRLMAGKNVLGLLATGGGKSLTYQFPSLLFPNLTLVVTPLISLMIDQVQQLKAKGRHDVTYLNSSLSVPEMRQILQEVEYGKYKLVYISPEKLQQSHVMSILKKRGVSLVAVDEAHCISQWGHDFRTDYMKLPQIMNELGNPTVLAVTATATTEVQQELASLFHIQPEDRVILSLNRENIAYEIQAVDSDKEKIRQLIETIRTVKGPGIVYCSTRQSVEQLVQAFHMEGITSVHGYHGGMSAMDRILIQEQFLRDELSVIIATNAFGMGIDKPNIRFVLHYHYPPSMEAYVQEVGRIGRDGKPGYACLFYHPDDYYIHNRLMQNEIPTQVEIQQFIQYLATKGHALGQTEVTHAELFAWVGLSEQSWRMLFFYCEQAGMIQQSAQSKNGFTYQLNGNRDLRKVAAQIIRKIEEVKLTKTAKLRSMQVWLGQSTCLREGLQTYFGERIPSKQAQCCSLCGLDYEMYRLKEDERFSYDNQAGWDLRSSILKLFPGVTLETREVERFE